MGNQLCFLLALAILSSYFNNPRGSEPLLFADYSLELQIPLVMASLYAGVACVGLSLLTNVTATALIGYKTWYVIGLSFHD